MKRWVILALIGVVGLASIIIGGCSLVKMPINPLWSPNQVLPQAKTNAVIIDFYAIELNDFPVEKEMLLREFKEILKEAHREWLGRPVEIETIDILPLSPDLFLAPPLVILPIKSTGSADKAKALSQEIIEKAKNNKEKYLVARVSANSLNSAELCAAFEKVYKSGRSGPYYIDTKGDKTLRDEVNMNKLLKNCPRR